MVQFLKKYSALTLVSTLISLLVVACANMSTPEGGKLDFDPPKIVRTYPAFNATNISKGKIVIEFDENIKLDRPSENVIITPPQKAFPIIQTVNRRITVELRDTLKPNTTYTIDFTSAIKDNNEGNPLENFAFSFSTGDVVDSMAISGKVLNAENLEPIKGTYVGLHSNLDDSAFTTTPFDRISRTNESGEFTIRGVAPGKYRLFSLEDANRDYKYDNPAEAISFFESFIEPSSERAMRFDTLFTDTTRRVIDTIKTIEYTRFLPDNIVMRSFKSSFQRHYLQKHERTPNTLTLLFGAPTEMPELEPLNFDGSTDWAVLEKSLKNDSITYWIKDQKLIETDTLIFRITYLKTDSLNQQIPFTDTLSFVDRTRKKTEKQLEKEQKQREKDLKEGKVPEPTFLSIKHNISSSMDIYRDIWLEFKEPIKDSLRSKIKLQQLKDSVYTDVPFQFIADSLNGRKYTIKHKWTYGSEFRLQLDSANVHSIYGLWNNTLNEKFKIKDANQYGQLAIRVSGVDTIPSFVELLDKADKPIRKATVKNGVALFRNVAPGTYYARIVLDENNNGVWDTGDYDINLQPEMVCYSQKAYEVKAHFEHDEDPWFIDVNTLAKQKPLEITKQKPQEKASRQKEMEERDQKNNRNNSNTNRDQMMGGRGNSRSF